jgi:aldehyde dehydrogenase (NAD+)
VFTIIFLATLLLVRCFHSNKVLAAKNVMEFPSQWRSSSQSTMYRYELLLKLAELIEHDKEYLMELESIDNNEPCGVGSSTDIDLVINCYRYYADWSCRIASVAHREPFGVCACIIPSCFPLLIQAWKLGPALACGNSIVMQSSTKVSVSALHVCRLIRQAGFPAGVVNMINGYNSLVEDYLVTHPDVEKVSREISPAVAEVIKRYASTARVQVNLNQFSTSYCF